MMTTYFFGNKKPKTYRIEKPIGFSFPPRIEQKFGQAMMLDEAIAMVMKIEAWSPEVFCKIKRVEG